MRGAQRASTPVSLVMEIRAARVDDVEQVLPLVAKIAALHESWDRARFAARGDVATMYRSWLRRRCEDEESVFLVADRDGVIVAFLVATIESNIPIYRLSRYGWLHDLYVEETYRNEGVGRSMTMLMLERFKTMGVEQIRIETAANNEVARAMFAQCGFRTSSIEMLCEL